MSGILESALQYLENGYSVVPLERGSKKALVKWKPYQSERATAAVVEKWFAKWPDANIGIITGQVSGIFVVDVDTREGLEALQERGQWSAAPDVRTSKVGHYYFRYPSQPVRNAAGILPGVDIRGEGGLVCFTEGHKVIRKGKGPSYNCKGNNKLIDISKIRPGDTLIGYSEETGEIVETVVQEHGKREVSETYVVKFGSREGVIRLTGEHPLYTTRGWVKTCDLKVGDELFHVGPDALKLPMPVHRASKGTQPQKGRCDGQKKYVQTIPAHRKRVSGFEKFVLSVAADIGIPLKYVGDGSLVIKHNGANLCPDFIIEGTNKLVEVSIDRHTDMRSMPTEERLEIFRELGYEVIFINATMWNRGYNENTLSVIDGLRKTLREYYGNGIKIEFIHKVMEAVDVYNIHCEPHNNYFVRRLNKGSKYILAHNCAPPSVHHSGVLYEWNAPQPLRDAPEWLLQLLERKDEKPVELPEPQRTHLNGAADDPDQSRRFVAGCLRSEVAKVVAAPDGSKHAQLLKSATYLAGYIPTGAISEEEIRSALFEAVASRAEDKQNALDTIRDGIKYGTKKPLVIPPPPRGLKPPQLRGKAANRYIRAADPDAGSDDESEPDSEEDSESDDEDERALNNGIYAIQNGRTLLSVEKEKADEKGSSGTAQRGFVWDGAAAIFGEISDEDGTTIYEIEGQTIHRRHFKFEMDAARMADPKAVAATVSNFAGAQTVIYAGMEKHLTPSIRSFTDRAQLRFRRRFSRVGWTRDGKEFIIPGLEPADVIMALGKDMAYRVEAPEAGNLTPEAAHALRLLLQAHRPTMTTVALAHSLLAPLAHVGDWRDDKFALFIAGRTGSFKTSWAAMLMCLYGDFSNEDRLLKFGMGGTNNALMRYTSDAADVPLLIDNFKPGTGNGQKDAQTLIHGVIEGGEKKRLNRDGTLRESKEIHCWPVLTGEDVIDDAASIARMLIVIARWDGGENAALTSVQGMSHLLPQIGGAWLSWLMTNEAWLIAESVRPHFYSRRSRWSAHLRESQPDMVNISRVASSLALCECAWEIALQCPALAPVLSEYSHELQTGLHEAAAGMGNYAAQTHEANRYLAAVRAMLLSNHGYLAHRTKDPAPDDRRAFLGWEDDDHVYLQPENTYREVLEFLRNQGGLNGLGITTLHRQLEQMGHIAKRDGKNIAAAKRVGVDSRLQRLLWINRDKIYGSDAIEEIDEE